jgi:hypothetical protein
LRTAYGLGKWEPWLEVPLDSHVAIGIKEDSNGQDLPTFGKIVDLTNEKSDLYQNVATDIARNKYDFARVHLDLIYWRRKQTKRPN